MEGVSGIVMVEERVLNFVALLQEFERKLTRQARQPIRSNAEPRMLGICVAVLMRVTLVFCEQDLGLSVKA